MVQRASKEITKSNHYVKLRQFALVHESISRKVQSLNCFPELPPSKTILLSHFTSLRLCLCIETQDQNKVSVGMVITQVEYWMIYNISLSPSVTVIFSPSKPDLDEYQHMVDLRPSNRCTAKYQFRSRMFEQELTKVHCIRNLRNVPPQS